MATSAQAQRGSWQGEIGIQGGFSRMKPSGTSAKDYIDLFDVPGFSLSPLVPSYGALFAIIPWKDKIAIEPTLSFSQLSSGGTFTLAALGLRADYALTPKVYAAVGGTLGYVETAGQHESQLGVQAALGYRLRLTSGINGRVEANWQSTKKSNLVNPANVYSVLFGISARHSGAAAPRAARSASAWDRVIGMQGGYSRIHVVGGGALNAYLNQATADASGRPVLAGPVEATAAGNLMVQAIAGGEAASLAEARRLLGQSVRPRRFTPQKPERWAEPARRFRDLESRGAA